MAEIPLHFHNQYVSGLRTRREKKDNKESLELRALVPQPDRSEEINKE